MADQNLTRKLVAILAADVAGYSRLIGMAEEETVRRLSTYREVIDDLIVSRQGRIFGSAGDSVVAEFASPVEAVRCAVEIQEAIGSRNTDLNEDSQMRFRIGVNLGDVLVEGENLLGDGVNVAARLEGLAEPGGIAISRATRDQVRDKFDFAFEDQGEYRVKNIARPVRVFKVLTDPNAVAVASRKSKVKVVFRRAVLAAVAALLVGIALIAAWQRPWAPEEVFRSSPLSARASIAVLPFVNLSTDPNQEYFSDGITNDIITDLSKFHDLFVIASNSTFAYKGRRISVLQIGQELGVRYVLEGSVQRDDIRIRINAQLIDAESGQHLWAERYDETIDNIFDLQDRITKHIVQSLAVRLTDVELNRVSAKPTDNLAAYDYLLKGRALGSNLTRQDSFEAREMFRRAIDLDPSYASAYSGLGFTYFLAVAYGWAVSPNRALENALKLAQKSLNLDNSDVVAHRLLGRIYVLRKQYDLGVIELERAIVLNPNDAASYADQGLVLVWSSRSDGAVLALETALRLDPNMGEEGLFHLGLAYYLKGRYEDAILNLERSNARNPDFVLTHVALAAAYGQIDNSASASRAIAAIHRLDPFFSVEGFGENFQNQDDAAKVTDGLRKAGL